MAEHFEKCLSKGQDDVLKCLVLKKKKQAEDPELKNLKSDNLEQTENLNNSWAIIYWQDFAKQDCQTLEYGF